MSENRLQMLNGGNDGAKKEEAIVPVCPFILVPVPVQGKLGQVTMGTTQRPCNKLCPLYVHETPTSPGAAAFSGCSFKLSALAAARAAGL